MMYEEILKGARNAERMRRAAQAAQSQHHRANVHSLRIFDRTKQSVQEWIDEQRLVGRLIDDVGMELHSGLLEDRIRVRIRAKDGRFRTQVFGLRQLPVTPRILRFIQDMFPGKTL